MSELVSNEDEEIDHEHDLESEVVKHYNPVILGSQEDKRHDLVEGEALHQEGRYLILGTISDSKFEDDSLKEGRLPTETVDEEAVTERGLLSHSGVGQNVPLLGVLHLVDGSHRVGGIDGVETHNSEIHCGILFEHFHYGEHELSSGGVGGLDHPVVVV